MGADGGSIPDRRDLVRTKAQSGSTDKSLLRELYILCALSKKPLSRPVVLDPLGKLYNKDAVLEYFIDKSKYGDGEQICGHLKGIKDLLTLNLTTNPEYAPPTATAVSQYTKTPFICPLSMREMSGVIPFIAIKSCGCVFSDAALRGIIPSLTKGISAKKNDQELTPEQAKAVVPQESKKEVACPNCGKSFDPTLASAIIPINSPKETQDLLLENLLLSRAAAKSSKKRKNAEKIDGDLVEPVTKATKKSATDGMSPIPRVNSPSINANGGAQAHANGGSGMSRSVQEKLAEQERKRLKAQEGMSEAVKAMFKPKNEGKKSGADEFFGRTFTRYAA
ncbi:uncharacterized protein I303_104568 [Kwoniella dejecticola CBS 10117]|uniref:Uncharacterized protein n=1 Tax=Kwoniella dejecticola CBS 10117 TaxID=1296121 RepID=A0A1A6A4Y5_9TREE|nr:uncharacterized protein I303_04455 [Kwoniella dejecticola CBS 10117]OBR85124.1 hypothetical protein I303_04455 [Kwoniella dejecticola CBS 10117]